MERFRAGRVLVVAFEGWNDAGDAATNAVRLLRDVLPLRPVLEIDPEQYFDFQFTRPTIALDEDGERTLTWPSVTLSAPAPSAGALPLGVASETDEASDAAPAGVGRDDLFVLLGVEPSRSWKAFSAEIVDALLVHDIESMIVLGAMLADVPHTRPISTFQTSESPEVRTAFELERSTYEGPVGILSVLGMAAEAVGIPSITIWASVPHYVHNAPSPKATLALVERLEEILGVEIPRGDLVDDAAEWESGIDQLAGDDEDMAAYIEQLERARDTVDSPEASGEAIAREFEQYLRRGDDRGPGGRDDPRRPPGA